MLRAWEPPCTLTVDYWKRSEETQLRKDAHVDAIDEAATSREDLILQTTLAHVDVALERNMFPYDCPRGIEHWTLWSREELTHIEICSFVEGWSASPDCPRQVAEWNYEENKHRSFDVPHVHCFFRFRGDEVTGGGDAVARITPVSGPVVLSPVASDNFGGGGGGGGDDDSDVCEVQVTEKGACGRGQRRARAGNEGSTADDTDDEDDARGRCSGGEQETRFAKRRRRDSELDECGDWSAREKSRADGESHSIEPSPCRSPHVAPSI